MGLMKSKSMFFYSGIIIMLFLISGLGSSVQAADVKALLKDANKKIRQAERDMFGGKKDKAVAALETIKEKLLKIKEADPNNPTLKTLENKFKKLVKDLERRTGKDLGGGSLTAAGASTQPKLAPKPEVKAMPEKPAPTDAPAATQEPTKAEKLPYHARGPISNAKNCLVRIDDYIQRLSDPKWNSKQALEGMDKQLELARENFKEGKAKAAEKGVTSHPDFDEIEKGITEAEKKIAEAKAGHAKTQAAAAAGEAEVKADVKALMVEYKRLEPVFSSATGNVMHYNDLRTVKELLDKIDAFEKNDLSNLKVNLEAFGQKYGTTSDEIDKKADSMGYSDPYYRASFAYTEMTKGIENVKKTRTVMADDLIRRATDMKEQTSKGIHDFARVKQHARIKDWGALAAQLDPENPRVKAFNGGLDAWIADDLKALFAKIDKAKFPEQASNAPGDAKKLASVIKKFLQKEEDARAAEGKEAGKVLAVAVTGPWRIFKKNILGEPIQYNLPIATAKQVENEKSLNLTRVYLGTMLTEEMKGVKKAPPFIGATVGDSYYIRPSALK
jgi:hypothetical protein